VGIEKTRMKILDDIISTLKEDSVVYEVYVCVFWTAVVSRHCGLASTLHEGHPYHNIVRDTGKLRGKSALELVQYAKSDHLLEASIGMAAINSLMDVDEARCTEENAFDILSRRGRGKNIAIVGHFPWTPELRKIAGKLWVIEQSPREGELPAETAKDILPKADVVGLTATALTNHTIEKLLDLSKGKFVVIIGPTSPLSPVLFDYGVDVISGTRVIAPEETIRSITEGAIHRQTKGIKHLNMFGEKNI